MTNCIERMVKGNHTIRLDFETEIEYNGEWLSVRVMAEIDGYEPAVLHDRPGKMICDESGPTINGIEVFAAEDTKYHKKGDLLEYEDCIVPAEIEEKVWDAYERGSE